MDLLEKAYAADRDLKQSVVDDRAGRLLAKAIWRDAKNSSFWARKFCNQIVDKYPRSRHVASATELLASIDSRDRKKRAGLYKETVRISGGGEDISTSRVQRKIASPTQRAHEANMKVNIDATQGSAQVASILAQADRHFGSAMGHYQKGRPGMSGFNMHLQEAVRSFDKAMALYERAQKSEPNNRHIDNRMTDCQKYGYHARKMQTLGGF